MTQQKQAIVVEQDVLNAVRKFTMKLSKRYDIARLVLFGSRARGDHHAESDVNLAIFLNTELSDFVSVKLDMVDDAYDFFLETEYYIQPLPVGNEADTTLLQYLNPLLLRNIRTEGIDLTSVILCSGCD